MRGNSRRIPSRRPTAATLIAADTPRPQLFHPPWSERQNNEQYGQLGRWERSCKVSPMSEHVNLGVKDHRNASGVHVGGLMTAAPAIPVYTCLDTARRKQCAQSRTQSEVNLSTAMDVDALDRPDEPRRRVKPNAVKHRSSQACQACRSRKVRCDVLTNGPRCTNCRLDRTECVVLTSRRGKNKHTHQDRTAQRTHSRSSQAATSLVDNDSDVKKTQVRGPHENVLTPAGSSVDANNIPVCVTFDEDLDNDGNERLPAVEDCDQQVAQAHSNAGDGLHAPGSATVYSEGYHSPTAIASLPAFITPLSSHILSEDIQYLTLKGAFLVPEPDLQLEILRAYLFSVHPFLPVLDSQEFVHAVIDDREQRRVSLLLFQAVMFAGLHSLQPSIIHRLGFETPKQAREVFFTRVRLLYDFDVEPNSTAVFQSLLLMSSWYSRWRERRHTWHWTGLAYDVARSMGLHRGSTTRHAPDRVSSFHRRLWWSLYIRDRMIALGTRRPMRIRDEDFDVTMLTLNDFDIPTSDELSGKMDSIFPSREEMTSASLMCIQLAKLSICIGHVVSSQYTTLDTQLDGPRTMLVVSRRDVGALGELNTCTTELDEWYRATNENLQQPDLSTSDHDPPSCSNVHWSILLLTHLTTVNVLHRAQAFRPLIEHAETQIRPEASRIKVKDAAREMTRLTQSMLHKDEARFLGLIGVTAIIAACLSHMLEIDSSDEDVRDASTLRLHQSVQVLQYLRGIYASADAAASFVASLAGQAGKTITTLIAPLGTRHVGGGRSLVSPSTRVDQDQGHDRADAFHARTWPLCPDLRSSALLPSAQGSHTSRSGAESGPRIGPRQSRESNITALTAATPLHSIDSASRSRGRYMFSDNVAPAHDAFEIDTTFGGSWNPGDGLASFDWNTNAETGMDLGLMSFSYDFYTDASGFLQGHDRDFQQY